MLLADTSGVAGVQQVGTILHDLFGGDYPEQPLAILQIAARAVFVYSATLLIVCAGKSRIISRTTTIDVILGFILGSLVSRAVTGSASISGTLAAAGVMVLIALGVYGHGVPISLVRHAVEGEFAFGR